jgi:hypothetical protein
MALVELIYDDEGGQCLLVPFARNARVGNAPAAAGPTVHIPMESLEAVGIAAIKQQLLQYAANDPNQPSGFYNLLPADQRERILSRSIAIGVSRRMADNTIRMSSVVPNRNIEANVPWDADAAEMTLVIHRLARKVRLILGAQQDCDS